MPCSAMRDLRAVQADFAAVLRAEAPPRGRMAVYHRNRRANFRKALALAFPVLAQLLGETGFARLAAAFQDAHPSRSGDLARIGAALPGFLRGSLPAQPWLADLADLERALQDCLVAPDAAPIAPAALAAHPPEDWPALHLQLHPALRLVGSPWPIVTVWRAHRDGATVDLDAGGEDALLRRVADGAEILTLTPGVAAWWRRLADGAPLGEALDAALAADPAFDPAAALTDGFALGIVTGCGTRPFPAWQSD